MSQQFCKNLTLANPTKSAMGVLEISESHKMLLRNYYLITPITLLIKN